MSLNASEYQRGEKAERGRHKIMNTKVQSRPRRTYSDIERLIPKVNSLRDKIIMDSPIPFPESMMGGVVLPLCVAGPLHLLVESEEKEERKEVLIPLATTELGVVASVNRGCKAIREAGGCIATITDEGVTRAPVLEFENARAIKKTIKWINKYQEQLGAATKKGTSHTNLKAIQCLPVGRFLYLRLVFTTNDAMGMTMATEAAERICSVIQNTFKCRLISVSGNVCSDKKPAAINAINIKGKTVIAEVNITKEILGEILHIDSQSLQRANTIKNLVGSARAGSLGFNAHHANMLAALFIATGQDPAHVVEGSLGITYVEATDLGAYISVTLPSLLVGTIGGGTSYPWQWECLKLMGVNGSGDPPGSNAQLFAQVVGGAVLAGELSLIAALATDEFVDKQRAFKRKASHIG